MNMKKKVNETKQAMSEYLNACVTLLKCTAFFVPFLFFKLSLLKS